MKISVESQLGVNGMTGSTYLSLVLAVSLFLCNVTSGSLLGTFGSRVADDGYGVAQGGIINGIPTANDDNDGGPDINDAINLLQGTTLGRNKDADPLFVLSDDSVWTELNGTIALIGLSAGFSNTVGVYTDLGVGAVQTPVLGPFSGFELTGDGTMGSPFPAALTSLGTGTDFGWYLDADGVTDYFSEPALNPAGYAHMMTFDLPGANGTTIYIDTGSGPMSLTLNDPFLITWEDLPYDEVTGTLGDDDYDDMMYIIDKVAPATMPEPTTFAIWSLLGLTVGGVYRWRRRRA